MPFKAVPRSNESRLSHPPTYLPYMQGEDLAVLRRDLGRELTDVELACFENLWSEHCSYRSTKTLLRTLPTEGKDVLVGPGDDAAVVRYSEDLALAVGMESHNHPSYVTPIMERRQVSGESCVTWSLWEPDQSRSWIPSTSGTSRMRRTGISSSM